MFSATEDGSVVDSQGRIIFLSYERFIRDIARGDCCFICGAQREAVPFNDEHVVPDWILRRFELHGREIQLSNRASIRYGGMTVPCCVTCNSAMGERFEKPMSKLFGGGYEAVSQELKNSGPWDLFNWMALMFLKAHLKDKYLNFNLDHRKGDTKISEYHSWEEMHHLHCVARSFYTRAEIAQEVLGSLAILPAKVRPHYDSFDFIDVSVAQTMLLTIGGVAVLAVFNDSMAALSIASEVDLPKIEGPLSPIQLRELAARFACINLQFEPRPQFVSEFDVFKETYNIKAEREAQVHIPEWNNDLFGSVMHHVTRDHLKAIYPDAGLEELVRSGQYTFLRTPSGSFDFDSMELGPNPSEKERA
jgi:hypothetical protein